MAFLRQIPVYFLLERPASSRDIPDFIQELADSGMRINQRIRACEHNDKNHRVVTHIIGIEKWSQSRLKVAAGADYRQDEYDVYRPPQDTRWDDMNDIFKTTRDDSLMIVENLPRNNPGQKIRHNQFGEITIHAWIYYIYFHALQESKRLK
ncbi:MAG: hypothetical protein ACPG7F_02730 [Aggregatilineales bacterium]